MKNKSTKIGALIGFLFSLVLILFFYVCENSFLLPNGSGYTSENVFACLIPFWPTIMIPHFAQTILQIKNPSTGIGTIIFHFLFYPLIGAFIGWIVYIVSKKT